MRKKFGCSFIALMLFIGTMTGCTKEDGGIVQNGNAADTEALLTAGQTEINEAELETETELSLEIETEEESFIDIFEQEEELPQLEIIYSERLEYPELQAFLQNYFTIPEEYREESRYYYNYADLNADGEPEIVAMVVSEAISDATGETILLLKKEPEGFLVIDEIHSVRTPVIICDNMTNGWHNIIFHTYGGGMEAGYYVCQYSKYGSYISEDNLFQEEIDVTASGRQILSNNLIDDMDKGNYLCLYPSK